MAAKTAVLQPLPLADATNLTTLLVAGQMAKAFRPKKDAPRSKTTSKTACTRVQIRDGLGPGPCSSVGHCYPGRWESRTTLIIVLNLVFM